jgi:hypothetical protein
MERITEWRQLAADEAGRENQIKRKIFEKLAKRMDGMAAGSVPPAVCAELNPDVIVISDDQSLLFEPQNYRALKLLFKCCGVDVQVRERIRVHPCKSREIIGELKAAGVSVSGEF